MFGRDLRRGFPQVNVVSRMCATSRLPEGPLLGANLVPIKSPRVNKDCPDQVGVDPGFEFNQNGVDVYRSAMLNCFKLWPEHGSYVVKPGKNDAATTFQKWYLEGPAKFSMTRKERKAATPGQPTTQDRFVQQLVSADADRAFEMLLQHRTPACATLSQGHLVSEHWLGLDASLDDLSETSIGAVLRTVACCHLTRGFPHNNSMQ